jgi:hypothetical protein
MIKINNKKVNEHYQAYLQTVVDNPIYHTNIKQLAPQDWKDTELMIAAVAHVMVDNQDVFSELIEPNKSQYKTNLMHHKAYHYFSTADMINFIVENSGMNWNKCCDYVRDTGICGDEGRDLWDKDVLRNPKDYNEDVVKWVGAFFEAHPWVERFYLIFDD